MTGDSPVPTASGANAEDPFLALELTTINSYEDLTKVIYRTYPTAADHLQDL